MVRDILLALYTTIRTTDNTYFIRLRGLLLTKPGNTSCLCRFCSFEYVLVDGV